MTMTIRAVALADAAPITAIYNHYILNTVVTFEETALEASEMRKRICDNLARNMPWFVAEDSPDAVSGAVSDAVIGYAYATPWRPRSAYRYSVEITVYVHPEHGGRGAGSQLYAALFAALKTQGFHTVLGGICLPNPASIALHEKFGLQKTAHLKDVGFKFERWIDVGYWQGVL